MSNITIEPSQADINNGMFNSHIGSCSECDSCQVVCDVSCVRAIAAEECLRGCESVSNHPCDESGISHEQDSDVTFSGTALGCVGTLKPLPLMPILAKAELEGETEYSRNVDISCANGNSADCDQCPGSRESLNCVDKEKTGCCTSGEDGAAQTSEKNCCSEYTVSKSAFRNGCCSQIRALSDKCVSMSSKYSVASQVSLSVTGVKRSRTVYEACTGHLERALNRYASYLANGQCICKEALNRFNSCSRRSNATTWKYPKTRSLEEFDCPRQSPASSQSPEIFRDTTERNQDTSKNNIGETSCCSSKKKPFTTDVRPKTLNHEIKEIDIEANTACEHVVLKVSGMTCTGCSRKVTNVLEKIDGVSSIKVTFVTSTAEFDFGHRAMTIQQLLARIQKETGFTVSRIVHDQQTLDIVFKPSVPPDDLRKLHTVCESIENIRSNIYRITYNPTSIGARSILSSLTNAQLAPLETSTQVSAEYRRLTVMIWTTVAAAILTIPVVVLAWANTHLPYSKVSVIELVLATGVQAIAIPEFYIGAVKSLIYSRVLEMDMLVVISITAAYGYSIVAFALTHAGYTLRQGAFFETSSLLITFVLIGRLIAAFVKARAVAAVSIRSFQVEKAILVNSSDQTTAEIDARLLELGDTFIVPPHSMIVTDGIIDSGTSSVDESLLTGESSLMMKKIGDTVTAGTTNGSGTLTVRLTHLPGKNSITDIAHLVENALSSKPRVQDLADMIASRFVPVVVGLALVVFAVWIAIGIAVRHLSGGASVGLAITYGIAVLAVSCPCAVGLAVPMVLVIAGGVAARKGVVIRRADAIEKGYKITDIVFDKTGTITTGELELSHHEVFPTEDHSEDVVLALAKAVVKDNQHPVSLGVSNWLRSRPIQSVEVNNIESIPGAGIQCNWLGQTVRVGNPFWLGIDREPELSALIEQAMTLLCMTVSSKLVAVFGLRSTIRPEAARLMANLQDRGLICHILSGDATNAVKDVAKAVGVPSEHVSSRQSPAQKQQYIQHLMDKGQIVLFCGDGTNDAAAVAQANIGVQMGNASDVTRATADVVLLGGLDGILELIELSKRSIRRVWFNFAWSAVYNVFAMLLASGAFVKVRIPPAYAGLGEIVSVLPVIIIAVTILRGGRHKP